MKNNIFLILLFSMGGYLYAAGDVTFNQGLGGGNVTIHQATGAGAGGGGSPSLEVFSNFDEQRTSPTASIAFGDAMKMTVSGSTAIVTVDFSSVTAKGNTFNTGTNLVQLSGGLIPNSLVDGSSVTKKGQDVAVLNATQTFSGQNTFLNAVTISTTVIGLQRIQWSDGTIQVSSGSGGGGNFINNQDILQSGATAYPSFLYVGSSTTLNNKFNSFLDSSGNGRVVADVNSNLGSGDDPFLIQGEFSDGTALTLNDTTSPGFGNAILKYRFGTNAGIYAPSEAYHSAGANGNGVFFNMVHPNRMLSISNYGGYGMGFYLSNLDDTVGDHKLGFGVSGTADERGAITWNGTNKKFTVSGYSDFQNGVLTTTSTANELHLKDYNGGTIESIVTYKDFGGSGGEITLNMDNGTTGAEQLVIGSTNTSDKNIVFNGQNTGILNYNDGSQVLNYNQGFSVNGALTNAGQNVCLQDGTNCPPGGGGGASVAIQDEGSYLTTVGTINFVGSGVSVALTGTSSVTVTVNGGGGGGSSTLAIATGSIGGFTGLVSSPTAIVNFSSANFTATLTVGSTAFIELSTHTTTLSQSFTVTDDGDWSNEVYPIFESPVGSSVTITQINVTSYGVGTSTIGVQFNERQFGSLSTSGVDVFSSTQQVTNSGARLTSFSNAVLAPESYLVFTTTTNASQGIINLIKGVVHYRKNR